MKVKVEYDYCDEYTGCDPTSCTMELPDDIDINDKDALLRWLDEEFPAEGTNSDGLDCNYIDPTIILDGKVICKRDDGELSGMYESKKLNENSKVTLTFGQLKRLVAECKTHKAASAKRPNRTKSRGNRQP